MYSVVGADGKVYGPADLATLEQWCREGRIIGTTYLVDSRDGRTLRAMEVPYFQKLLVPSASMAMPLAYPVPAAARKSKAAAILLAFFLGPFGVHRYYLGHNGSATAMLLLTVVTCGVGGIVTGIWALIDMIAIASGSLRDVSGAPLI